MDALIAAVQKLRPGATYDALKWALRNYRGCSPGTLVEPDDEPDTLRTAAVQPENDSHQWPAPKTMHQNIVVPSPRMTLVPGDIHIPIWDRDLVMAVLAFAEAIGVDHLAIAGDLFDVYGASRFSKQARDALSDRYRLVTELRAATGFFQECSRIFQRVDYLLGNHEGRIDRFVDENPWLWQHPAMDPRSLYQLPDRWHVHDWGSRLRIGSVCIEHGDKLKGAGSKYGAAAVLRNNLLQHTIFGHTHRIMRARHTVYDHNGQPRCYSASSVGHLSHLHYHADYANQPDWAHGFAIVEHGEYPQIHVIEIHQRRWKFGGVEYGVR